MFVFSGCFFFTITIVCQLPVLGEIKFIYIKNSKREAGDRAWAARRWVDPFQSSLRCHARGRSVTSCFSIPVARTGHKHTPTAVIMQISLLHDGSLRMAHTTTRSTMTRSSLCSLSIFNCTFRLTSACTAWLVVYGALELVTVLYIYLLLRHMAAQHIYKYNQN